jgi:hypothetical protein
MVWQCLLVTAGFGGVTSVLFVTIHYWFLTLHLVCITGKWALLLNTTINVFIVAIQESFVHPAVSQLATYYDHVWPNWLFWMSSEDWQDIPRFSLEPALALPYAQLCLSQLFWLFAWVVYALVPRSGVLCIYITGHFSNAIKSLRTRSRIQKLVLFFVTRGLLVTVNQICFLAAYEAPALSLHWYVFSYTWRPGVSHHSSHGLIGCHSRCWIQNFI